MKKLIFAMVATAVAIAFSSCYKRPTGPPGQIPTVNYPPNVPTKFHVYIFQRADLDGTVAVFTNKNGDSILYDAYRVQHVARAFVGWGSLNDQLNKKDFSKGPAEGWIEPELYQTVNGVFKYNLVSLKP